MTPTRIIAVDFDGCICTNAWPKIGQPIQSTIQRLHEEKEAGSKLILWTCRNGKALMEALEACRKWGCPPWDAVNRNIPEVLAQHGYADSRKVTATEYWDDRARRMPEYEQ